MAQDANPGQTDPQPASPAQASPEQATPGGTDLGRRIAEQRDEAHLTVDEVADRAGMAPRYLRYLETSPAANPTPATLTRLAVALDVTASSLAGAGLNMPPGQRSGARHATLHELTPAECRALIATGGIGRFVFVQPGRGPVAIPVNFKVDGDDVIFRTGSDSTVAEGTQQQPVSFDVDHLDDALGEGWSVLLTGTVSVITSPAEVVRLQALDIEPWAGGDRNTYVRLTPTQITGRRIRVSG
jgi:transcriptional regulator with XRE-family HTH domain